MDLEEEADPLMVLERTSRLDFPNGRAYEYLDTLDLGSVFRIEHAAGELRFIDGACPGNDYLGVEAADEISLSLLQPEKPMSRYCRSSIPARLHPIAEMSVSFLTPSEENAEVLQDLSFSRNKCQLDLCTNQNQRGCLCFQS